jgi:hypothetical protein
MGFIVRANRDITVYVKKEIGQGESRVRTMEKERARKEERSEKRHKGRQKDNENRRMENGTDKSLGNQFIYKVLYSRV